MSPGRKKGRGKTGSAQATGKAGTEAIRAADSQAGPARKVRSGGARNARTKTAEALASKVRKPARRKTPAEQSAVAAPESTRRETRAAGSRELNFEDIFFIGSLHKRTKFKKRQHDGEHDHANHHRHDRGDRGASRGALAGLAA